MKKLLFAIVLAPLTFQSSYAADLGGGYCQLVQPSQLMSIESNSELSEEVVRLMTEAVNVADNDRWINNTSPAFTWASEAKVACGKAYGYLRTNTRDAENINKCECFHQRMVSYIY